MDVVENMVDGDTILDQVDPENRDIFREIFLNDDSEEEFLGFDPENLENVEGTMPFVDTWVRGNLDVNCPEFRGEKKINVDMGEDSQMLDFFRLFISDEFIDALVRETNKYAADFFNSPKEGT